MEILITERTDIIPLLGNGLDEKVLTSYRENSIGQNQPIRKKRIINKFPDLFKNNKLIKDTEINIQLKLGHYALEQKTRPIPLHVQENVGRDMERLIKTGHIEKVNNVDEDCFV